MFIAMIRVFGRKKMNKEIQLTDAERQPCEVWTRVMGYHRPVSEFNKGKKSEYYSRLCFSEEKAKEKLNGNNTSVL